MKLIFAIVNREDEKKVMDKLGKKGFIVTRLSSTGGFLKAGNATLLIGVSSNRVEQALEIIKNNAKARKQVVNSTMQNEITGGFIPMPLEINIGGATVFVVDVDKFEKV